MRVTVPQFAEENLAWMVLTAPDGKPFRPPSPGSSDAVPLYAGRGVAANLLPGIWSVTVHHADGRTWTGSASVTAGETAHVTLP